MKYFQAANFSDFQGRLFVYSETLLSALDPTSINLTGPMRLPVNFKYRPTPQDYVKMQINFDENFFRPPSLITDETGVDANPSVHRISSSDQ